MAITGLFVSTDPGGYPSLNDNLFVMATSDLSLSINFRYVVDIFDTNGVQLVRSRVYPDAQTGACYFDVASILRNEIRYDWFYAMALNNGINSAYCRELDQKYGECGVFFTVKVGEEYYSGIDLVSNLQQSTAEQTGWNFVPPVLGRMLPGFGLDRVLGTIASVRNKYYDFPVYSFGEIKVKYIKGRTDPLFFGIYSFEDQAQNGSTFIVNVYDASGAFINNGSTLLIFQYQTMQQLNFSPKAINAQMGATVIDFNTAAYYTIEIDNFGVKSKIRVDIVCPREGIEPVHLHFINSYGIFETAIFDLVNKKFASFSRKGYINKGVQLGTTQNAFVIKHYEGINGSNPTQYEKKMNFDTAANYTMKLAMDFPTDEEYEWLPDLIASPQIFMSSQTGAGYNGSAFYPVTIKADNYEYFQRRYNKLKPFEIEIELNQQRNFYRR